MNDTDVIGLMQSRGTNTCYVCICMDTLPMQKSNGVAYMVS